MIRSGAREVSVPHERDAASLGTCLPTYLSLLRGSLCQFLGPSNPSLSRNVGNQLPSDVASHS